MKSLKRGTKVIVRFEGVVVNSIHEDGIRVSVKGKKPSWWAVVPTSSVRIAKGKRNP